MLIRSNLAGNTMVRGQRSVSPIMIQPSGMKPGLQVPVRNYQKYCVPPKPPSILLQLAKKGQESLPPELSVDRKPLADFCNFLSEEIYRYVLANNNQYSGESKQQFRVDVQDYKLTRDQLNDLDLRKSAVILLNEYLQFTVAAINEMASQIKQMENGRPGTPFRPLNLAGKNSVISNNSSEKKSRPEDGNLTKIEQKLMEKERKQIDDYLKDKAGSKTLFQENNVVIRDTDLQKAARGNAEEFLALVYDTAVEKMETVNDNKMNDFYQIQEEEEQTLRKSTKFQLDEWG